MENTYETPIALRKRAIDTLQREMGPVAAVRFFQQYETGEGNYTKERAAINENIALEDIFARIEARRSEP